MAENSELGHGSLKALRHELLLVHEALPEARSPLVVCEAEVGLEAELADIGAVGDGEGRSNLASVVAESGEADTLEEDLEEDLGIKSERRLMDGVSSAQQALGTVSGVLLTLSKGAASRVGSTWSARATVWEARRETTSKGVNPPASSKRSRMSVMLSWGSGIRPSIAGAVALGRPARNSRRGAPCHSEGQWYKYQTTLRRRGTCTDRAVGDSDSTGKLDEVTSRDLGELGEEGDEVVDRVGDAEVCEECGLDGGEDEHRSVSSSTTVHRLQSAPRT